MQGCSIRVRNEKEDLKMGMTPSNDIKHLLNASKFQNQTE